jgi:hypothetical protein
MDDHKNPNYIYYGNSIVCPNNKCGRNFASTQAFTQHYKHLRNLDCLEAYNDHLESISSATTGAVPALAGPQPKRAKVCLPPTDNEEEDDSMYNALELLLAAGEAGTEDEEMPPAGTDNEDEGMPGPDSDDDDYESPAPAAKDISHTHPTDIKSVVDCLNSVDITDWPPEFPRVDKLSSQRFLDRLGNGEFRNQPKPLEELETKVLQSHIKMAAALKGHPLTLFKKVMDICYEMMEEYGFPIDPRMKVTNRASVLKAIDEMYGLAEVKPQRTKVVLPATKVPVNITWFHYDDMALLLLTYNALMQGQNLLLPSKSPFGLPPGAFADEYNDLDSGSVWKDGYNLYCTNKEKDVYNGHVFFQDKTHMAGKSKITLEPLEFTFGLFRRQIRNMPRAWMKLGYVPNIDQVAPQATSDQKSTDLQFIMQFLFAEFVQYQRLEGIDFALAYPSPSQIHDVRLHIPIHVNTGDTEGHDKLLGKVMNYKSCRICNALMDRFDKPYAKFTYTNHADISDRRKVKVEQALPLHPVGYKKSKHGAKLWEMGYKDIGLDYTQHLLFADKERGPHGATPAEILHAFLLGILQRAVQYCLGIKVKIYKRKANADGKKKKKKKSEEDDEDEYVLAPDDDPVAEEQDGQRRNGVFVTDVLKRTEALAAKIASYMKCQSDQTLPRMCFPNGITKLSYMQASEFFGVAIILFLILVIEHNHDHDKKKYKASSDKDVPGFLQHRIGKEECNNLVHGLQLLLLYGAFCKSTSIPKSHLEKVEKFIPQFLDKYFASFPRKEGNGNQTLKAHLPVHTCDDIKRFGSPENFSSSPGEHNHIENAKIPVKNTQRRHGTVVHQVANRWLESYKLKKALSVIENEVIPLDRIKRPPAEEEEEEQDDTDSDESDSEEEKEHGPAISYSKTCLLRIMPDTVQVGSKKPQAAVPLWSPDSPISCQEVVDLVRKHILNCLPKPELGVSIITKTNRDGQIFHAHPCCGTEKLARQHWAYVNFEIKQRKGKAKIMRVPCHLLCFLHISQIPKAPIGIPYCQELITTSGYFFIGHSLKTEMSNDDSAHYDQQLVYKCQKWNVDLHKDENCNHIKYQKKYSPTPVVYSCDTLGGPLNAFPDFDATIPDTSVQPHAFAHHIYYLIRPFSDWAELFHSYADNKFSRNRR